ncbi:MAG: type I restriction-modification system subunit M N-terminal domain-containing protein, partial [Leptolyngbya sp.]|nr:type I restriction-modification system subunit M N-terminal domain-containing protein [Leptolyngbya sp.]
VKSICDIMRRSNCAGALQYVPELTWILFLRLLDDNEAHEQDELEAVGQTFTPSIGFPYRWREWAAPYDEDPLKQIDGLPQGWSCDLAPRSTEFDQALQLLSPY